MKALIIDDEKKARNLLHHLLNEKCSEITTILEASDLEIGVAIIKKEKPDIVYLDIEMPKYTGLQIIELLDGFPINFQIIFTTGYNNYAIEAFKLSAIDYLLKPIDINELVSATQKAIKTIKQNTVNTQLNDLKISLKQLTLSKIALEIPKGIIFVSYDEILLFEADRMYTKVYLTNNQTQLICKPIKHFVEQLNKLPFFYKIHRSYLVNLKHVKEFSKKDGHHLILTNNKTIPISRDKRDHFMELIHQIFNP